jgi:RNA polymerase sigma-70 factor (ECF subfamily)
MEAQYPAQISVETLERQASALAEDRDLIAGVLAKDRKATGEFVARCADWLYPFVRRRLVPRVELLEDLVQEIVLAAWQALPKFRGEAGLRSWVMGIARHKLDDYYRKRINEVELSEDEEYTPGPSFVPELESHVDATAVQEKVQKVLTLLPEAHALALIWRYRDEKKIREMAKLVGKTEKAMERLLARARENFRRRWSDAGV